SPAVRLLESLLLPNEITPPNAPVGHLLEYRNFPDSILSPTRGRCPSSAGRIGFLANGNFCTQKQISTQRVPGEILCQRGTHYGADRALVARDYPKNSVADLSAPTRGPAKASRRSTCRMGKRPVGNEDGWLYARLA